MKLDKADLVLFLGLHLGSLSSSPGILKRNAQIYIYFKYSLSTKMDKRDFFRSLGFSEYETDSIVTLIKLKIATPKEISIDSGVPQNKLYAILNKFESYGILSLIPSGTKRYKLINLKTFIDAKVKEKEKRLKEIKKNAANLDETDEGEFVFSLIKGQKTVMNKLAENNVRVKKEILGVQRNWKIWGEGIKVMKDAVKRGVDVKMIGVVNDKTKKRAEEWKKIGCKVRAYNKKFGEFPLRFTIFDNKEARITIGKPEIQDPKEYITIWTKSKPLINTLRSQFMTMWESSR